MFCDCFGCEAWPACEVIGFDGLDPCGFGGAETGGVEKLEQLLLVGCAFVNVIGLVCGWICEPQSGWLSYRCEYGCSLVFDSGCF